ncbi:MAG: hypothetical protein C4551_07510 [Bacillota bacterium]|nr:MAG: hypothetical protein C4551_07510 [Bacillota bacterium]
MTGAKHWGTALLVAGAAVALAVLGPWVLAGPPGAQRFAGGFGVGSCCGSSGGSGYNTPALDQLALDTYRASTGDQSPVDVRVRDYGCHLQADIYRDGEVVKRYFFASGQWVEIP